MIQHVRRAAVFAALLLLAACATSGTAGGDGFGGGSLLLADEIDASQVSTVHELIQQRRPQWLRMRGISSINRPEGIVVYLDGSRFGGLESLQSLSARDIARAERIGSAEATLRFGTGHTHGAILLSSR